MGNYCFYTMTINGKKKYLKQITNPVRDWVFTKDSYDATMYRTADPFALLPLKARHTKSLGINLFVKPIYRASIGSDEIEVCGRKIYLTRVI